MYAMVYPKHLQKSSERRWENRVARELPVRRSRPEGSNTCFCANTVTASVSSQHSSDIVINKRRCSKCNARWTEASARCG